MTTREHVLVGVAEGGSTGAVAFALDEARRRGLDLRLRSVTSPSTVALTGTGRARAAASAAVDEAMRFARDHAGAGVTVVADGDDSFGSQTFTDHEALGAHLVVLQRRRRRHHVVADSYLHTVVGRLAIPAVVVPEDWTPAAAPHGVVTVAVQDPGAEAVLLRAGLAEAQARNATVVVLHAWCLAPGFDVAVDRSIREEFETRSLHELAPVLGVVRAEYPGVPVEVRVVHGEAAPVVLAATDRSDLVVLGRRHHLLPLGSHLGPVVRAVLEHGTCPVMVTSDAPADLPVRQCWTAVTEPVLAP